MISGCIGVFDFTEIRDSSVGMVIWLPTGLQGNLGFGSLQGQRDFLVSKSSTTRRGLGGGIKEPGRESDSIGSSLRLLGALSPLLQGVMLNYTQGKNF